MRGLIKRIKQGRAYKHISKNYNIDTRNLSKLGLYKSNQKYSEDVVCEICDLISKGYKHGEILKHFNKQDDKTFSFLINRIRSRKSWIDISKNYRWSYQKKRSI